MNRTRGKHAFFGLAAWVSLAGAASCFSGDEAPAGGRVAHPPQRAPMPVASAAGAQDGSQPLREGSFTPLDQAIADDCGSRAWSRNVPDRDCTNDSECGDGFCDRGHCAEIWTCGTRYGQRCINSRVAPSREAVGERCLGICLEERCRSCQSDAECEKELGGKGYVCGGEGWGGRRFCGVLGPKAHRRGP